MDLGAGNWLRVLPDYLVKSAVVSVIAVEVDGKNCSSKTF